MAKRQTSPTSPTIPGPPQQPAQFAQFAQFAHNMLSPVPNTTVRSAALLALILTGATLGQPGPQSAPTVLEDTVITATRAPAPIQQIPSTVYQADAEQLQRALVRTLPEALAETPGILVQKTSHGQGSPFIRGFTGYRTLALIDGIRYNNSILREGPNEYWALLDPQAASGYELIPGPGAVLYGSDAVGGTLNLLTKNSNFRDEAQAASFFHGSAFHRYHTSENSNISRLETAFGQGQQWGLHLGYSLKNFGDLTAAGPGKLPHTGYDQSARDARFDAALAHHWTLTLAHQNTAQSDAWRTHSTVHAIPFAGTTIGTDRRRSLDHDRSLSYLRIAGREMEGPISAAQLTVSYQTMDEEQLRIKDTGAQEISGLDLGTIGLDLQMESITPFGHLTYGAEYYRDRVDSTRFDYQATGALDKRRIQGPVGDDSTYQLAGLYLQDRIEITPRTELHLGARYTYASADIGAFEDPLTKAAASFADDWNDFTGSLKLTTKLDPDGTWNLFGGASQSFRAPNLSDLSRLDIARSNEIETAATGLSPEQFLTFELGLKAKGKSGHLSAAYFFTNIDDLIVRTPTGRRIDARTEVTKANGGSGHIQGIELAGDYQFAEGWSVFGNVGWQDGEAETYPTADRRRTREPISRLLPLTGTLGLRWAAPNGKAWTELLCTAAAKADQLNTADKADTQRIPPGGTPGYALLTLRGGWNITENITALASLENILDEAYRTHGSGTNEPGIGASLGLRVSF